MTLYCHFGIHNTWLLWKSIKSVKWFTIHWNILSRNDQKVSFLIEWRTKLAKLNRLWLPTYEIHMYILAINLTHFFLAWHTSGRLTQFPRPALLGHNQDLKVVQVWHEDLWITWILGHVFMFEFYTQMIALVNPPQYQVSIPCSASDW